MRHPPSGYLLQVINLVVVSFYFCSFAWKNTPMRNVPLMLTSISIFMPFFSFSFFFQCIWKSILSTHHRFFLSKRNKKLRKKRTYCMHLLDSVNGSHWSVGQLIFTCLFHFSFNFFFLLFLYLLLSFCVKCIDMNGHVKVFPFACKLKLKFVIK